jgi:hypothetical protein
VSEEEKNDCWTCKHRFTRPWVWPCVACWTHEWRPHWEPMEEFDDE